MIKFSRKRTESKNAKKVKPTSNANLKWEGCSEVEKLAFNDRLALLQDR